VLEAFTASSGNEYSAGPTPRNGVFYGTTQNGANGRQLAPKVYFFSGADGADPTTDLYIKKGKIYGTTQWRQCRRGVQAEDIAHLRHAGRTA
jgi:hypothetical protein